MKRTLMIDEDPTVDDKKKKNRRNNNRSEQEEEESSQETRFVLLDEDLLFEVLKHLDAGSLAIASSVNKQWHWTAHDERLWELVCTRHWMNINYAINSFRGLHSHCLWPLLKLPPSLSLFSWATSSSLSTSSLSSSFLAPVIPSKTPVHWGKDEIQLSLSLLSIRYFEKMNVNNSGR
uniref:F-box domain-containing protein n=1 Tax=Nelumbo nucifera TaxID=4432 RepID=A0A822XNF3_NELNU|nr:TPA_asm: hypothetical protein HUJ06_022696 [Nelumbo nucifera]